MADDKTYIPDCLFPSDNDAEVPSLRLDMQPQFVDIPFVCFGEQRRTFQMNGQGTLHTYTDDYRFSSLYEHPEKILAHHPRNIVEPNFSLFNDMPVAFGLQAIYKKRFIARAMQERGIRVFVDLNVASKFYRLNMLGVPLGYAAFATRGYSDRLHYLEFEWQIARDNANGNPLTFVIYGGGEECREFARTHGCVYINPMVTLKKRAKAIDDIGQTVAFFGQEFSVKALAEEKKQEISNAQVADFRTPQEAAGQQKLLNT